MESFNKEKKEKCYQNTYHQITHTFSGYVLMTSVITAPISADLPLWGSPPQSPPPSTPINHWFDLIHYWVVVAAMKLLINEITYIYFCFWLLLFNVMFLRFIHVIECYQQFIPFQCLVVLHYIKISVLSSLEQLWIKCYMY